jgi:integrase
VLQSAAGMKDVSIYTRKGSRYYWMSYWCKDTLSRVSRSTGIIADAPGSKLQVLKLAEKRAAEASTAKTVSHEAWSSWVHDFISDRYRTNVKTLTRFKTAWRWLSDYLAESKVHTPAGLSYNHVSAYVSWRTAIKRACGKAVSRNTAIVELKFLGLLMQEAVKRGFAMGNPALRTGIRRDPPKQKPEMSNDEIKKIRTELAKLEAELPYEGRWMSHSFEIALHQGCRLSETSLPMEQVDLKRGTIRFIAKGRNGEPHVFTTALHPGLRDLFGKLKKSQAQRSLTLPAMASVAWMKFFREHGMRHLCFHCTRVTAITRLARAGVPISQAMRYVGHANEAVHAIYQRLGHDDLGDAVSALSFPRGKSC